ncbi:MAG: 50S ribosomal protein L20 [Longimicrobiales bacterium]
MPRSTHSVARNKRKKKVLKAAKGYFGGRKNLYKTAKDAVEKGWEHAYRDRKKKKRNFRRLWITRINAAAREHEMSYSRFMNGLRLAGVELDRKALADLAVRSPDAFQALADQARTALDAPAS